MSKNTKNTKKEISPAALPNDNQINSKEDLNKYLLSIRDRLSDQSAPPVFVMTALNSVMRLENIYSLLSAENKEIARDIWLRLKRDGMQVANPPLLFDANEGSVG